MSRRFVISVVFGFMPFFVIGAETTVFNSPTRLETNLGTGCHIAITLPINTKGGISGDPSDRRGGFELNPLPDSWKSKSFSRLFFALSCGDGDADKVTEADSTVSIDPNTGIWKKDVGKWVKSYLGVDKFGVNAHLGLGMSQREYRSFYKTIYKEQEKAIHVYNVAATNAKGYASTVNDPVGDDKKRQRRVLGFCLFYPPKVLCGSGDVGMVADGPQSDLSARVLEILQTVEFLPDEE